MGSELSLMDQERDLSVLVNGPMKVSTQCVAAVNKANFMLGERCKRRVTKMITGLGHLPYEERLKHLGFFSLEKRRLRGDMIETYKIMQGRSKVDRGKLFSLSQNTRTRGHTLKLSAGRVRTDKRKYFFTQRIVSLWNSLPHNVVMASDLDAFKRGLERFLEEKSITGYKP